MSTETKLIAKIKSRLDEIHRSRILHADLASLSNEAVVDRLCQAQEGKTLEWILKELEKDKNYGTK